MPGIISLTRHQDYRGFFQEIYSNENSPWKQVNWSNSHQDVLRGIHVAPYAKLVTCITGKIWDVVVNPITKEWICAELYDTQQMYVPANHGHGFLSLKNDTNVVYLQSGVYNPTEEYEIRWNDPELNINWPKPVDDYIISEKDKNAKLLKDIIHRFQ